MQTDKYSKLIREIGKSMVQIFSEYKELAIDARSNQYKEGMIVRLKIDVEGHIQRYFDVESTTLTDVIVSDANSITIGGISTTPERPKIVKMPVSVKECLFDLNPNKYERVFYDDFDMNIVELSDLKKADYLFYGQIIREDLMNFERESILDLPQAINRSLDRIKQITQSK